MSTRKRYKYLTKLDKLQADAIKEIKNICAGAKTKSHYKNANILRVDYDFCKIKLPLGFIQEVHAEGLINDFGIEYNFNTLGIIEACRLADYLNNKYLTTK